ncbi:sec34-like family domain-containing protein [Hirsutella rhossiliensis]|uniref:Conserved oligomeric Golgi complex subunit 3 n=1 Tax=Hirsutella rhossiliensis TaxID=111463 RepID=A0A9P8MRA3_9HYPO|nr:sec34-like family domain-containing protein [Hirsutella rhossiliensis]KAH0959724.1 sec34-like family domain-containing protein [Hirsutella rhossiliensis]
MYEDSWYSFVPEITSKKPTTTAQPQTHRRSESLGQQPNGTGKVDDISEPLENVYEEIEDSNTPPEPTLTRRAASYSDFYRVVKAQLAKDGGARRKNTPASRKDRSLEALTLCAEASAIGAHDGSGAVPADLAFKDEMLEASQQEYLLYQDQLTLTERHLDGLIDDANAALKLLTSLSNSFQSVETQTSSFQSKCEGLLTEQRRLEKLADEVGTDLHYYAYLDTATRRLNAPGASRLVEDEAFGDMVENIDSCIHFMSAHESYRERESYLARYNALLTKALHLLDHAFTGRLEKVSPEIARQIAATKSESARHALAYGRFEEMITDSYSLLPNIQRAVRCAYDPYGRPVEASSVSGVYANSAANMFRTYLTTRDRDLKAMTQHHAEEFQKEVKNLSVETACRNFIKQSFEKMYNEDGLFSRVFNVELMWNSSASSAFQAIKAINTSMAHPGNLAPLATSLQNVLQTADLQAVCNVVGWLAGEYSISESDDEESPSFRRYREYAARLLVEHLWSFTDGAFAAEVTKSISKAPMQDGALKIEPAVDGAASSNAYPLVRRAIELLAMFDQAMPKERSAKNSSVVFNIIRETIQVLQRAEARIRSLKTGTDADLFMIQNLLMIKNELFSLEIGDIRSQPQSMQHFGRIWDTLSPQNWTLTAEDMSEQLDELLRQSIYAFTKRWGTLINDSQSRKTGVKPIAKVEAELESMLANAFQNHPEVISKLKEAIWLNAQAQNNAKDAKRGAKRY